MGMRVFYPKPNLGTGCINVKTLNLQSAKYKI